MKPTQSDSHVHSRLIRHLEYFREADRILKATVGGSQDSELHTLLRRESSQVVTRVVKMWEDGDGRTDPVTWRAWVNATFIEPSKGTRVFYPMATVSEALRLMELKIFCEEVCLSSHNTVVYAKRPSSHLRLAVRFFARRPSRGKRAREASNSSCTLVALSGCSNNG